MNVPTWKVEVQADVLAERAVRVICSAHACWPGGMSHRELAERSGLTKSYVTNFLNGKQRNPTLYTLAQLALALDARIELNLQPTLDSSGEEG